LARWCIGASRRSTRLAHSIQQFRGISTLVMVDMKIYKSNQPGTIDDIASWNREIPIFVPIMGWQIEPQKAFGLDNFRGV
jgi:hypothetical protein